MRGVQAACPACAGPVRFRLSSALVTVCEYCRTVVARTDRKLEDFGKVAAIVETASPLHLGLTGIHNGKRFRIVGRIQHQHAAGGLWDEWYAAFPNQRWGWLAEAQGRFYLTFKKDVPENVALPSLDELTAGKRISIGGNELAVAEVGTATTVAAEGEMPFTFHPGESHQYADLYGSEKRFVTLDYNDERPQMFVGTEVTLDDIGIGPDVRAPDTAPRQISALQVNCPQCGGPLALFAPDKSQRVVCGNCHAMLDASQGNLQYLRTLDVGRAKHVLAIGATGTLNGVTYTVTGFVRRSVTYDGVDYYWTEYLLYEPRTGFRWLIHSESHWSFGEPVSPGEVKESGQEVWLGDEKYKLFQKAEATVRYVLGEFYWKVELGETTYTLDFIAPPRMLTIERSAAYVPPQKKSKRKKKAAEPIDDPVSDDIASEVNYTLSTYVPHEVIEQAFGVESLTRPWSVAPNQPSPVDGRIFRWWAGFLGTVLLLYLFFKVIGRPVDGWLGVYAAVLVSALPVCAGLFRHSVEVSRWKESDYNPYASSE